MCMYANNVVVSVQHEKKNHAFLKANFKEKDRIDSKRACYMSLKLENRTLTLCTVKLRI